MPSATESCARQNHLSACATVANIVITVDHHAQACRDNPAGISFYRGLQGTGLHRHFCSERSEAFLRVGSAATEPFLHIDSERSHFLRHAGSDQAELPGDVFRNACNSVLTLSTDTLISWMPE